MFPQMAMKQAPIPRNIIARKYFIAFLLIIVFPVVILNVILNHYYLKTLLTNAAERTFQTLEQISIGIESETGKASLLAEMVAGDAELLELITRWNRAAGSSLKNAIAARIDAKLKLFYYDSSDIHSMIFIYQNQRNYYCFKNAPVFMPLVLTKFDGYQRAMQNSGKVVLTGSLENFFPGLNHRYLYSAWIKPDIGRYPNEVGMIYFAFRTKVIDNIYAGHTHPVGEIFITDDAGRIIGPHNRSLFEKDYRELSYLYDLSSGKNHSFTATVNHEKMLITSYTSQKPPWKIINFSNYRIVTRDVQRIWRYSISVFGLLILLFLVFTLLFFREIIIPLNYLTNQMKQVERGNFQVNIPLKGNNEIARLGESFNKMIAEINKLMIERDLKEQARSRAELEALKSQINPHFIANTLNSIRLMAAMAKVESIKTMAGAFMKLLNSTLGKDAAMIPVTEELDNLQNYVYIMKVRYGDKFEVVFDTREDIKHCYIIKMVLQPIIENAILHGVSELEERRGLICITGRRFQNNLLFEVKDNGAGIPPERAKKLLDEDCRNPKGFSSMGIRNVDRRIKLNHGEQYGLEIASVPGESTTVKILVPVTFDESSVLANPPTSFLPPGRNEG